MRDLRLLYETRAPGPEPEGDDDDDDGENSINAEPGALKTFAILAHSANDDDDINDKGNNVN